MKTIARTAPVLAALAVAAAVAALPAQAANGLKTLHLFNATTDGSMPNEMIQGSDGYYYGTTMAGGAKGAGTFFRMTTAGVTKVLYTFDGTTAKTPRGPLVDGHDGYFYGVAFEGGDNDNGVAFRITPKGVMTVLHKFPSVMGEGYLPTYLVNGNDGNFYGTTLTGSPGSNLGTLFRMTRAGVVTTLHVLKSDGSEGAHPDSLMAVGDGTYWGAADLGANGCGAIFKMTNAGVFSVIYNFPRENTVGAPCHPAGRLVDGSGGFYYGTTQYGGANGHGAIYRIPYAGGTPFLMHSFDYTNDGASPGGVTLANDFGLYGTTSDGGPQGGGTLFKLTADTTFKTLHAWTPGSATEGWGGGAAPMITTDSKIIGGLEQSAAQGGAVYQQLQGN
jgi:uncharacterized repeat protein (TIGR03803 family)